MKRLIHEIAADLVEKLWNGFLKRVSYARQYNELVIRHGGRVVIDHIGFRSLNTYTGEQPGGIWGIRHIFESLGYDLAGKYNFQKKKLKAVHFEPCLKSLPKIFISQLEVEQLPSWAKPLFMEALADTPYLLSDTGIELLNRLKKDRLLTHEAADALVHELVGYFRRPWDPPKKDTILQLNEMSHYAAWTLLHGNAPSHFASFVNEQNVHEWPDLKTTCQAMQENGIPMKRRIEGTTESLIIQSATLAVKEEVTVREDGNRMEIPWTYGYLELIQRGHEKDHDDVLFQNFVEDQEKHLYQLTVTLEN